MTFFLAVVWVVLVILTPLLLRRAFCRPLFLGTGHGVDSLPRATVPALAMFIVAGLWVLLNAAGVEGLMRFDRDQISVGVGIYCLANLLLAGTLTIFGRPRFLVPIERRDDRERYRQKALERREAMGAAPAATPPPESRVVATRMCRPGEGTLLIYRPSRPLLPRALSVLVVDGRTVGTCGRGRGLRIPVSPGDHEVIATEVGSRWNQTPPLRVQVTPDCEFLIEVRPADAHVRMETMWDSTGMALLRLVGERTRAKPAQPPSL